jgi:metallo-beta-lactamase class B
MPLALLLLAAAAAAPADLTPIDCRACPEWNLAREPFALHGRSWYVGTEGLSAVLIDTGDGLVLIDGALPQSAPLIAANIASLGFRLGDVKWILNSHPHFDHAGGIAALQRMSGAKVATTARSACAPAMRRTTIRRWVSDRRPTPSRRSPRSPNWPTVPDSPWAESRW